MKRYYILLLGLCMMSSIQAQDNDPRKAFDRFAQRSKQKFDDFRSRANEQYAEAMKRAWERRRPSLLLSPSPSRLSRSVRSRRIRP